MIDSHPIIFSMVDTDPSKTYSFEFFLEFWIDTESIYILKMNKRYSNLCAVVMFPKVFTKTLERVFHTINGGFDGEDHDFSLTCIFINS